jgi:hypothetical protein
MAKAEVAAIRFTGPRLIELRSYSGTFHQPTKEFAATQAATDHYQRAADLYAVAGHKRSAILALCRVARQSDDPDR